VSKKVCLRFVALAAILTLLLSVWGCGGAATDTGGNKKAAANTAAISQVKAAKTPMPAAIRQPNTVKATGT
ncbi:hypothetical protein JZU71_04160, partial [bacterium]|nr:hypothetical protein [bacterium]